MGYFSNGSEGEHYCQTVCRKCVHYQLINGEYQSCPVLDLHQDFNYDECNKKDSFLHRLIPRKKDDVGNEVCLMFYEDARDRQTLELFAETERKIA